MGKFIALLIGLALVVFAIGAVKNIPALMATNGANNYVKNTTSGFLPVTNSTAKTTKSSGNDVDYTPSQQIDPSQNQSDPWKSQLGNEALVGYPVPGQRVKSPLVVTGSAPQWWFENGEFSMTLMNEQGQVISEGNAVAQDMITSQSFVRFKATLTYTIDPDSSKKGTLLLRSARPGDENGNGYVEIGVNLL